MFKRFVNDKRGVGWVLGVAVLSILLLPFVYFPLSFAWDQLFYQITGDYVFTGTYASSLLVVQVIIEYAVIFGLLFTINWAIVQAKSERYNP